MNIVITKLETYPPTMVICRFFQQGTCKFGNNCRYEHVYGGYKDQNYRKNNQQFTSSNNYGGGKYQGYNKSQPNGAQSEIAEIIQAAQRDFVQSEKGGQWPLSCYSTGKDIPCFPGLKDFSPDEIRWMMYEALLTGKLEECHRYLNEINEDAKLKRQFYIAGNSDAFTIIEKLMQTQRASTFSFIQKENQASNNFASSNVFGAPSVFGGASNQSNIFFTPPQQQTNPNTSIFGGASTTAFNTMPQSGMFGVTQGAYGVPQGSPALGSLGSLPGVHQSEMFSNNVMTLQPFNASSPFDTGTAMQSSNLFQPSESFGNPTVFYHQTNNPNVLDTLTNSQQSASVDSVFYSLPSDVTEMECKSFQTQSFTMGMVPTKPPPKELL